ncbi:MULTISPECIES: type II toxin-antitoxin system RelE/ParE family toxin [unclassified Aureimonas]|uniref:type II toxin-antitoxin system RelE/ParE family toxin n=1 Tax=unclassified Aureimonas TaxID=2615206 RepID=UPI00070012D5|nr:MULTISPECIES: type II toxin-antitoxin system RelE/ParE family toxin [unclassified Aureimonas]KQT65918.1 hypothetical protein ASG62_20530 [Aureimonas sp. Leaf427]KQT73277.1 hypothetical protein ASG54_17010 [Aureimonas sp. Leaf460]
MTTPIFTDLAQRDLRRAAAQSLKLFGLRQSRRYVDRLTKGADALARDPRRGHIFDPEFPHHRRFLVEAHYLIYRQRPDGGILIVRILHSRMNLSSHL